MSNISCPLSEIINLNELKDLFEVFSAATGYASGLIDHTTGKILVSAGMTDFCCKFHLKNSLSLQHCIESHKKLATSAINSGEAAVKPCTHGLTAGCSPLVIEGKHVATIRMGQVLFSSPDIAEFKARDEVYDFDEKNYLEALNKVPIVEESSFNAMLTLLAHLTKQVIQTAMANLEAQRKNDELSKQKALLKALINSTPDLIFYKDKDSVYLGCNKAVEEFTEYKEKDIIGKTDFDLVPREIAEIYQECDRKIIESGKPHHDVKWITYPDGRKILHDTLSSPYLAPDGEVIGLIGISRDISKLKEAEEKLQVILDTAPDGIFLANAKTQRIIMANKTGCNMLGYTLKEIKKLHVEDIHPQEVISKINKGFERHSTERKIIVTDFPVKRKDGSIFYSDITSGTGILGDEVFIIGVFRDITNRKRADKELLKIEKLESVGILAGGIAHDYNNILTAILGNIGMAETCLDPESEAYAFLKDAEGASVRAKALTAQLLTFAKGGDPVKETASMDKIIVESASYALPGSSVVCNCHMPEDLWKVDIDSRQMGQVIKNMILNARNAMTDGGTIQITCENVPALKKSSTLPSTAEMNHDNINHIKIIIADTGTGIRVKTFKNLTEMVVVTPYKTLPK